MLRAVADRAARVVRHLAHRATAPFLLPARISDYVSIRIDTHPAPPRTSTPEAHGWPAGTLTLEEWRAQQSDDPGVDVDRGMPDYTTPDRGWMQTITGRRFYPLAPRAEDIDIYDIAHGLAMCCRYAGHTEHFYSVAEHCVHVSRQVEFQMRDTSAGPRRYTELQILQCALAALLHDSSEAYLGDMIRPLKHQPEMAEFRTAEANLERVVRVKFELTESPEAWALIKSIDDRIIADEIAVLKRDVSMYRDVTVPPLGVRIECWGHEWARERFLMRFNGLVKTLAAAE